MMAATLLAYFLRSYATAYLFAVGFASTKACVERASQVARASLVGRYVLKAVGANAAREVVYDVEGF